MSNLKSENKVPNFSISMNHNVRKEVDEIARNFGFSRSQLIEFAVVEFITDKSRMENSIKKDSQRKLAVLKNMEVKTKEEVKQERKEPLTRRLKRKDQTEVPKRRRAF